MSLVAFRDSKCDSIDQLVSIRMQPVSVFLTSAFAISTALQLFNWFSKRLLGTILGLWMASQCFGLMTKFGIMGIYEYFPSMNYAEMEDLNI